MIEQHILGGVFISEGLSELLGDPETRRVPGDLEVKNSSAVMGNHKEAVQHAEGQSGDREEIHGRDHFPVIAQESLPSLTWISPPRGTLYPARNGPLGNIKAQLKQFSVDARCAPGRILRHHREDELAELLADRFSTTLVLAARKPIPIKPESGSMPPE